MIRVRSALSTIAVTALVGSLALAACKKEGGEVTKETGAALTFLPKDTKIVFGMNLGKLASAPILEKYKAEMMKNAPPQFSEMQAACGIDIFKDFSSIVVGMVDDHRAVAVVSGNFTKDKVESCIKKVAEKEGKTFEAKDDGKLRVYSGAGDTIYAHWLGDGSVAMTSDDGGGAALLNEILGGAKLGDGDVMTMVKSTKTSAGIWAAGKIDASMTGGLPVGGDVSGFAVTVNASDTLDIKAMASFADPDKASQAASQARMALGFVETQPKLAPFVSIIKKLKIESDGKALKVGVSLDAGDLEKLKQIPTMM